MKLFKTADEFNKFINTASRAALMELYKQNQKIMKSKKKLERIVEFYDG